MNSRVLNLSKWIILQYTYSSFWCKHPLADFLLKISDHFDTLQDNFKQLTQYILKSCLIQ